VGRGAMRRAVVVLVIAACGGDQTSVVRLPPTVVQSPLRMSGALVKGASAKWYLASNTTVRYGEPVTVEITAYCLTRTQTRRGRYVRAGIVATDPKLFPLSRYLELYVGKKYLGRYLIDDTGLKIKGNKVDVWMP